MATELLSKREIENTTTHSQIINLHADTKEVELFIDRTNLKDSKVAVACQLFLSLDGESWRPWGGFGAVGGEVQNAETKSIETKSGMTIAIPDARDKVTRRLSATITVIGKASTDLKIEER